jgi:Icc-related predicted phosphoesterase
VDIDKIKQRDRWSCRSCGTRFTDLQVYQFDEQNYITLCSTCLKLITPKICSNLIRTNKVVLIGDCHGKFEVLDRVLSVEEPFDFFISVGDMGILDDVTHDNIKIIDKWKNKGYEIRGNHFDVEFFNPLSIIQEIKGLKVAALNGIIRPDRFIKSNNCINFSEVLYLSHIKDIDILVTHQAPSIIYKDKGEKVLTELLTYTVPRLAISGHIHAQKTKFYLNTFCISLPMIHKGYSVAYFQGNDLRNLELVMKKGKRLIRV